MSLSTFKIGKYSVSARTPIVEVVCGFLLKNFKENSTKPSAMISETIKNLEYYLGTYFGFILIELPELQDDDLNYFTKVISKSIVKIQAWGDHIPLNEIIKMQQERFLPKDLIYTQDMPTHYILDYYNQLKRMLELPTDYDLSKENQSTIFLIIKED